MYINKMLLKIIRLWFDWFSELRALAGNGGGIATLDFRSVAFERPWPRAGARCRPIEAHLIL
jgi:hypothetical protein